MAELEPRTLVSGLVVGESPRWHDGRPWFANWGAAQEIRTVDLQGRSEVIARGRKPAGYCTDFLPTGDLLVTGEGRILRRTGDGSFVTHADLCELGWLRAATRMIAHTRVLHNRIPSALVEAVRGEVG